MKNPDDNVCLCFHVSKRKLVNYVRIEKPVRASLLSECGGAGTGCGWCVPFLNRIFDQLREGADCDIPAAETYAQNRQKYIQSGKGAPPE